ncbi:hypothetical protein ACOSQ3_030539 [Xanthoceras sorbifolium]
MDNRYMVATPFPGWNWMLKRELQSIGGLSYYIDSNGIVHIAGKIHPYLVIDILRKSGIHAVICKVYPGDNHYYRNKLPPLIHHGFNGYHGYYYNGYGYMPYPQQNWHHHHHHHYPIYPYY